MTTASPGRARAAARPRPARAHQNDPLWYKDAVIYELHVRAFADSDADGIGDFRGLTGKLDYLADLGVTALWLLPFYPSPLRDDGYDIADFRRVNPSYGTLNDVRTFIREAHKRGLKVITELVCNHTSDQHPWFQRARTSPKGSWQRDFYVWSDTPDKYPEARIIFKDFEPSNWSWDPVAEQYFWHRFYGHQPDLNFDNPKVLEAVLETMEFWLDLGVDGLRLDAIPYLIERDGTNGENLPETHAILRQLRTRIDERYGDRMLLAEANQWPEDSVRYFGDGDECHMAFHFPVMPRLFMAIRMEDRFPIIDILAQTPPIPETSQWAFFLRNHDELTLEMVTDEERDYMYRAYASDPQARINLGIRRRLAPLLGNNRRRIELMNGLLFSLPGTPVVYYGDEIGMGDNMYLGDRNGVRTPMQWSADRNAGFSAANRQRLYFPTVVDPEYHYETVNVEAQQGNPHSLLWWMRRLIELRKRHPAFGRGTMEIVEADNRKIFSFIRRHGDETLLVVANLSRYVQWGRLDLAAFEGLMPIELFGSVEFPAIDRDPYFLSLGPHSFLWFRLSGDGTAPPADAGRPRIERPVRVLELPTGRRAAELGRALAAWMPARRWYRGRTRKIRTVRIGDAIPVATEGREAVFALADVEFTEGEPQRYQLVLGFDDFSIPADDRSIVADLVRDGTPAGHLLDVTADPAIARWLLALVQGRARAKGRKGELVGRPTKVLADLLPDADASIRPFRGEQSNTSIVLGERGILKLYRVLEAGENPDVEIGRHLTTQGFTASPEVGGWLDYVEGSNVSSAAIVQRFVPNEGDVWDIARDAVDTFLDDVLASGAEPPLIGTGVADLLALGRLDVDPDLALFVGRFLETSELLGRRTGELHRALVGARGDPAFEPETFTPYHQRSLYQSIRGLAADVGRQLVAERDRLPGVLRPQLEALADLAAAVDARLQPLIHAKLGGQRIRVHGDFHVGQTLMAGTDIVITDFEGEPLRTLSERRMKRPPLTDVAGMIRSFHYAAHGALVERGVAESGPLVRWADLWYATNAAAFLRAYLEAVAGTRLLPEADEGVAILLDALVLQKAVYELRYELSSRPDWLPIPLRGIRDALGR